tara:strand:- start:1047 stop:2708 length:1662 start_codon:yes stop_codon:yes gene_type:complete
MSIEMTYGDYRFDPVPLINVTKEFSRGKNRQITGLVYKATLTGSVVAGKGVNTNNPDQNGIVEIDSLQDQLFEGLTVLHNDDSDACGENQQKVDGFAHFNVTCGGETLWDVSGVRVNSIEFEADVWVDKSDYTIELEWDGSGISGLNVEDFQETWDMSPAENTNYFELGYTAATGSSMSDYYEKHTPTWNLTHTLSAIGKPVVDEDGCVTKSGSTVAAEGIQQFLGFDENVAKSNCVLCFDAGVFAWNHSRSVERDEVAGRFGVTETWLVRPSGINGSTESLPYSDTFSVDVQKGTQAAVTTATIRGTVEGYQETFFCSGASPLEDDPCAGGQYGVLTNKYDNAKIGLDNARARINSQFAETLIYRRMNYFASGEAYRPMNVNPTEHTITHDPAAGTIQYSFTFDDKPKLCAANSLYENYTINDTNQADRIAEIPVIGRVAGPILQSLGTSTVRRRNLAIDLVVAPNLTPYDEPTAVQSATEGCGSGCDSLGAAPSDAADIVIASFNPASCDPDILSFKTEDSENWEPLTGKYSRRVVWTFTECPSGVGYTGV